MLTSLVEPFLITRTALGDILAPNPPHPPFFLSAEVEPAPAAPVKTNAAGVAHFELKSPDDFAPSSVGADETITVYFAVFDAQDECLAFKSLQVKTGEKNKPLTLELKEPNE